MRNIDKLNSRQWELHEYLKVQTDYVPLKDVCLDLGYTTEESYKVNSGGYRVLVEDIRTIREFDTIKRIPITSRSLGVKYASTEDEAIKYIERLHDNGISKVVLANKLMKKLSLDGQTRLVFTKYEKDIIESLMENNNEA